MFSTRFRLFTNLRPKIPVKMNVFTQKLNPITGKCDWEVQDENYDFHQEVARSAFADMLHDTERNRKYEEALKTAISHMHSKGKKANVLDIGTGTGLLSMMAVRNGADSVVACEAFKPMSDCAKKIIEANGFAGKIKVVPKRSTDLIVGENGDLPTKANILVTEVFDTELIGEGAISTFKHAHDVLLEKLCIVVPQSATIYAQVVESPLVHNWNKLNDVFDDDGELLLKVPSQINTCFGAANVHDLQLSQLDSNYVNSIVRPQPILHFDWSGKTPFRFEGSVLSSLITERAGTAQGVFMWWDLVMDVDKKIILSCAPIWAHPDAHKEITPSTPQGSVPWRDHWMQAVYYLPKEIKVSQNEAINLLTCHDEYSLWFNLQKELKIEDLDCGSPMCNCGLHLAYSRTRIGQLNDSKRNKKYLKLLQKHVRSDSIVLILSHGFYLGMAAAKFGAKKVICYEENTLSRNVMKSFVSSNNLPDVFVVDNMASLRKALGDDKINFVLGEPYFVSSIIPWHNIFYVYLLKEFDPILAEDVRIFPKSAVIKSAAVEFEDLHKIRTPLGLCEGFSMEPFDCLIKTSSQISDENVEAQPLWEYPGQAKSEPMEIARFNLEKFKSLEPVDQTGIYQLIESNSCNGIAFWVDWDLDGTETNIVSSGPTQPIQPGEKIQWDMHSRQGVHLFTTENRSSEIKYKFKFDVSSGNISFVIC